MKLLHGWLLEVSQIRENRHYPPKDLMSLFKKGEFHLAKWLPNSCEVMESIPTSEHATSVKDFDFDHAPVERVLGMR